MRAVTGNRHLEHQRVRSSRGIVRKQCNGRDSSDARTNCLPSSRPAVAFFCGGPRTRNKRHSVGAAFLGKSSFFARKEVKCGDSDTVGLEAGTYSGYSEPISRPALMKFLYQRSPDHLEILSGGAPYFPRVRCRRRIALGLARRFCICVAARWHQLC
jgi:hypothetical protein